MHKRQSKFRDTGLGFSLSLNNTEFHEFLLSFVSRSWNEKSEKEAKEISKILQLLLRTICHCHCKVCMILPCREIVCSLTEQKYYGFLQ